MGNSSSKKAARKEQANRPTYQPPIPEEPTAPLPPLPPPPPPPSEPPKPKEPTGELVRVHSRAPSDQYLTCSICDERQKTKYACALSCGHDFCYDCAKQYVKNAIASRQFPISCPSCKAVKVPTIVSESVIRYLTNRDQYYDIYIKNAIQSIYLGSGSSLIQCPRPDCASAFEREDDNDFVYCPECQLQWCLKCDTQYWHHNKPCPTRKPADDVLDGREANRNIAKCPNSNCGLPIERSEGCNHMTCPQCHWHFCLLCNSVIAQARQADQLAELLLGHYNAKGTPCYAQLFTDPNEWRQ
ncbi:uncharacterized protein BJ171DRAFT_520099 [Polychytrium aggregatum]|uniref:uncharacterized protein n=1 Tax=Polychytrium aggregatum TaxID=110093 RepID=UPI0022FE5F9B|nr:uncharacterized protein BJ171DRAFT_520099 [Polychytrium aggregatum]KAI9197375.1 hypothetical protein BJ171DRAFT_520099 [Polychytrium aggregatum]